MSGRCPKCWVITPKPDGSRCPKCHAKEVAALREKERLGTAVGRASCDPFYEQQRYHGGFAGVSKGSRGGTYLNPLRNRFDEDATPSQENALRAWEDSV